MSSQSGYTARTCVWKIILLYNFFHVHEYGAWDEANGSQFITWLDTDKALLLWVGIEQALFNCLTMALSIVRGREGVIMSERGREGSMKRGREG